MAQFHRLSDVTEQDFMTTIARPAIDQSKGVVFKVDREPTAAKSVNKFFLSKQQLPDQNILMSGVGLRIDGRSSIYDLWSSQGNVYAVDGKSKDFVAKVEV